MVLPLGFEPKFPASEASALSIELREQNELPTFRVFPTGQQISSEPVPE